jgi:probable phosphoglycerate mutase
MSEVFLIRHAETDWTLSGRHTGRTDIPLTPRGEEAAQRLASVLASQPVTQVLSSPLSRARRTCELTGFGDRMTLDGDLMEWDYGRYEGLTSAEILALAPGWQLFADGCPGGESPADVAVRADRVITQVRRANGISLLFAHGHLFRVLAARWLGWPAAAGAQLLLDPATVSVLGENRGIPAIKRWNIPAALNGSH